MRADYTQVFQDAEAVEKYEHVVYAPDSYATAINRRQRRFLRGLVIESFSDRRPVQHDFACGTGRAIRLLHGLVRTAHGYDTSAAMLAKAGEVGAAAQLHQVPATGPVPEPARTDGPAIVTVFRLLLNVDDEVRERALAFAAQALPHSSSGLLVIENHGNRSSLRHLRAWQRAGDRWFAELSHEQVRSLLSRHGFRPIAQRGFSMFPKGWYEQPLLRPLARLVDGVVLRLGLGDRLAVNVLYVARRSSPVRRPAQPEGAAG